LLALVGGVPLAQSSRNPAPAEAPAPSPQPSRVIPTHVGQVRIETETDHRTVTVGDPIRLIVRLIHPKDVRITEFDPDRAITARTLLGRESSETTLPDGLVQETRVLRLAAYKPGDTQIPSLEATFADAAGKEDKVATPPVPITVGSVLTEGDARPADIKNPFVMPELPLWPFIVG